MASQIKKILLREILDSRGNLTVEAEVQSAKLKAMAAAPSGASVGKYEAKAFPKGGPSAAIKIFREKLEKKVLGQEINYEKIDKIIKEFDPNREIICGNLSTAISLAVAKLQAFERGIEFYQLMGAKFSLPLPLGNIIGGGVHSGKGSPELQEFLILPIGAKTFKEAAIANSQVHKAAGKIIDEKMPNFTRGRNDEGAWAPPATIEEAIEILKEAVDQVNSEQKLKIRIGIDLAASEFYDSKSGKYNYKNMSLSAEDQVHFVVELFDRFNLYYFEDPLQEEDFDSFAEVKKQIGKKCLIVGDDLTVTNPQRVETAISKDSMNSLIVKPNQIGSLSETESVIKLAKRNNLLPIVSHRSGETVDVSIAHIAVGHMCPIIKTGAVGGERVAKLDELIRIEETTKASLSSIKL